MRRHRLVIVSVVVLGLCFFVTRPKPEIKISLSRPARVLPKVKPMPSPVIAMVESAPAVRQPAQVIPKDSAPEKTTDTFQHRPEAHLGFHVVTNFIARQARLGQKGSWKGFELLATAEGDKLNIIFNPKLEKYGVWTGEITLKGPEALVSAFAEKHGMTKLTSGFGTSVYELPENVNFEELNPPPQVKINPDLIYAPRRPN